METETIKVYWCGEVCDADVVRRYKNGNVRVAVGRRIWTGDRSGSLSEPEFVTVEAWQVQP